MKAELQVRKTIEDHGLIAKGDKLVLGLSGGPDSLCLLHVLADLRKTFGFELYALHLNHLMRGERAEADAAWLSDHCKELNVTFRLVKCDVYAKAENEGICVEEAGRYARHEALAQYAEELGGAKVVFAHNRDDQAETVLMRILRGTGVHGLAAMEYKRKDNVIRPLLDTPRTEIEAYCENRGLKPLWDCTNADLDYTRNRLRLQLLPQLAKEYNPSIKDGLARLASNAREDDDYLNSEALLMYAMMAPSKTPNVVSMSSKFLASLHPAIYQRVLRMAFAEIGLTEDIAGVHVDALRNVLESGAGGKLVEFPGGYTAKVLRGVVTLERPL